MWDIHIFTGLEYLLVVDCKRSVVAKCHKIPFAGEGVATWTFRSARGMDAAISAESAPKAAGVVEFWIATALRPRNDGTVIIRSNYEKEIDV